MNKVLRAVVLLLIVGVVVSAVGCKLLHDKVIEIVLKHSACLDFVEYETTANFADPETLRLGEEVDDALADIDLTRNDIIEAKILTASYEVTELGEEHNHDWILSGAVLVTYGGTTETIIEYDSQSIEDAMGGKTYPDLTEAGVELLNEALFDYYELGADPEIIFSLSNDSAIGDGGEEVTEIDPLDFTWQGCIKMFLIVHQEAEVIDPF